MIRVTGVREIDQVLKGLPLKVEHKILQSAYTEAVKPTINAAYFAAPLLTGKTAESIGVVKTPIKRANAVGEITAGPRRKGKYRGRLAHLFEYGTKRRETKAGANRGSIRKQPFMEPAWEKTKNKVIDSIAGNIGKKLYQFMKQTIKNA